LSDLLKIRDIKVYVLEAALAEPFAYSQAWYERRGACLVEIVGEDGNSGWGEAFGPARLTAPIIEFYKPLLIGEDALATERHWQTLYNRLRDHGQKGLAIEALSAIDIALWDLKGRHLGLPVYRLIGGPLRDGVEAYATGFYRKRGGDPFACLVEEAHQRIREGFTGIKLKLGFGLEDDARLCETVRRAIGSEIRIMVDANHAYDAVDALRGWIDDTDRTGRTRRHRPARLAVGVAISKSPKALHHLDLLERAAELARYARTAGHGPIAFDRRSTPNA